MTVRPKVIVVIVSFLIIDDCYNNLKAYVFYPFFSFRIFISLNETIYKEIKIIIIFLLIS